MGVTGLWQVLEPCARPIKIDTLNKKRLAVDASIWIYQFLKAVRDKEGNALRNSHVVGFFRRICKLLFFGIKPVFVFDGGAPVLKRQTINARKSRREGRREDAVRTAGKLLAVQMQRRAEEQAKKQREAQHARPAQDEEEELPENLVYVEELNMTEGERVRNRNFKKQDAYHLPALDVNLSELGAPNDPRIMSQEELEEYARQFQSGEDINLYDFSKIDFDGPFFSSLPASDRYNILNAARLRSRLRMGYSKEQLDTMFPDRMAFSKFQVERVTERNELTQRLMNLNGMNGDDFNVAGRIAGERAREYVLVKNDGVEGGWALGVVSDKDEGKREKPIDVEMVTAQPKADDDDWEDVDGFIDVPIEGLNRLPKPNRPATTGTRVDALTSEKATLARRALYDSRKTEVNASETEVPAEDPDALFVRDPDDDADDGADELFEDVLSNDDEELQRAIAMSLEQPEDPVEQRRAANEAAMQNGPKPGARVEFNRKNAQAGRAFAHVTNDRAQESMEGITRAPANNHGFNGPLPFESIGSATSFLRPKKKKVEDEGGFEKEPEKKSKPLPPWFAGDVRESHAAQKVMEQKESISAQQPTEHVPAEPVLRNDSPEVIDVDEHNRTQQEPINITSESEFDVEMEDVMAIEFKNQTSQDADRATPLDEAPQREETPKLVDLAEDIKASPPQTPDSREPVNVAPKEPELSVTADETMEENVEWSESDYGDTVDKSGTGKGDNVVDKVPFASQDRSPSPEFEDVAIPVPRSEPPTITEPVAAPGNEHVDEQVDEPLDMSVDAETTSPKEDTFIPTDLDMVDDQFSDPEDEDLMRQLAEEAEEHARFASTINADTQLQSAEDYERELKQLRNQQKKDRRDADEVTQVMIQECQQLLQLFGLPYITAPMEAEAQCAELVTLGLVDGIVTDDSDTFLFGGTRVYKNMFNQAKVVQCYLASDLEKEFSLSREKIIQIAHLLGSDYTEGLPSVGPVTALEILSEFETLDSFKDWWTGVQNGNIPASEDTKKPFRRKFRKNATKLFLPPIFPDTRVDEAYLHPEVDSDPSPFHWGVPDLDRLRAFLMATIGWGQERADEILVPVIKDMNKREQEGTQANITKFFGGSTGTGSVRQRITAPADEASADARAVGAEGYAPRRRGQGKSKRMTNALERLHDQAQRNTRDGSDESQDEASPENSRQVAVGGRKRAQQAREDDSEDESSEEYEPPKRKARKRKGNPSR